MAISWIGGPTEREKLAEAGIYISLYQESTGSKFKSDRWFKHYLGFKHDPAYIEKRKKWQKAWYKRNSFMKKSKELDRYHKKNINSQYYAKSETNRWMSWIAWIVPYAIAELF